MAVIPAGVELGPANLFARLHGAHQLTVFQTFAYAREPATVCLPLPVPADGEPACRAISMGSYPGFFADLAGAFGAEEPPPPSSARVDFHAAADAPLPDGFLAAWSGYRSYHFASFSLPGEGWSTVLVAFSFASRFSGALYFPTLHSAGGSGDAHTAQETTLYAQSSHALDDWWQRTPSEARSFMSRSRGIVDAYRPCFRGQLSGTQPNGDRVVMLDQ